MQTSFPSPSQELRRRTLRSERTSLEVSLPIPIETPTQQQWLDYLCRLRALPSVTVGSTNGPELKWDNLYDYYAEKLSVNSSVSSLADIEYCSARAILHEFAELLDKAIKDEQSFWNFSKDAEELKLMKLLRETL